MIKSYRLKILVFLICANLALPASLFANTSLTPFDRGVELRQKGFLNEAETQLQLAIAENPGNADYHFELANVYAARFDRWKEVPNHPEAQELLEKSAHSLEQAVMIRGDFLPAHFNLGVVYKKQGEYEKAREQFKKVLQLNSKSMPAWMQIGEVYELQGFFDEAKDSYLTAKEFDYFNSDINGAIEELKHSREEYEQMRRYHDANEMVLRRRGIIGPNSGYRDNYTERNKAGALAAAPFLASMLLEQFLFRKAERQVID